MNGTKKSEKIIVQSGEGDLSTQNVENLKEAVGQL